MHTNTHGKSMRSAPGLQVRKSCSEEAAPSSAFSSGLQFSGTSTRPEIRGEPDKSQLKASAVFGHELARNLAGWTSPRVHARH